MAASKTAGLVKRNFGAKPCNANQESTWRHIFRQCASDWMTLGPAMRKNGAAAWSSWNSSEYCRPQAGSLCESRACVAFA